MSTKKIIYTIQYLMHTDRILILAAAIISLMISLGTEILLIKSNSYEYFLVNICGAYANIGITKSVLFMLLAFSIALGNRWSTPHVVREFTLPIERKELFIATWFVRIILPMIIVTLGYTLGLTIGRAFNNSLSHIPIDYLNTIIPEITPKELFLTIFSATFALLLLSYILIIRKQTHIITIKRQVRNILRVILCVIIFLCIQRKIGFSDFVSIQFIYENPFPIIIALSVGIIIMHIAIYKAYKNMEYTH
ncbi:MAG: hypothetical protein E7069_05580 [Bacteroidales bacterium]|nr:hypothetical protein [Bacteroidales bacterium]